MTVIGRPIDRVDPQLKVTGAAKYAAEFNQPRMAYAFPARSTVASGTIPNAIFNATGKRIRDLPITPDKLF